MIKIFISHASEDKDAIARPLAEALKSEFEVWYDEYRLVVGDSLREKIDEGLGKCNFGIVILSRAFFQKKWPQAELDGLFALEKPNRKMILPVWHGVTKEEVEKSSPILAGRLASLSSRGVDVVAQEIKFAVSASRRTEEISSTTKGLDALRKAVSSVKHREFERNILFSEAGVQKVYDSVAAITKALQHDIEKLEKEVNTTGFNFARTDWRGFLLNGPHRISVSTKIRGQSANNAQTAEYFVNIFLRADRFFGDEENEDLESHCWKPKCDKNGEIVWQRDGEQELDSAIDVASTILEALANQINHHLDEQE